MSFFSNNLNAFFFTTPVAQPGSGPKYLLTGAADWESPDLGPRGMCLNWCDDACTWETPEWSTMHIYLSSDWQTLTCPNADAIGRSCEP